MKIDKSVKRWSLLALVRLCCWLSGESVRDATASSSELRHHITIPPLYWRDSFLSNLLSCCVCFSLICQSLDRKNVWASPIDETCIEDDSSPVSIATDGPIFFVAIEVLDFFLPSNGLASSSSPSTISFFLILN